MWLYNIDKGGILPVAQQSQNTATSGCNKQPDTQRLKALCMEIINISTKKKENTEQNCYTILIIKIYICYADILPSKVR